MSKQTISLNGIWDLQGFGLDGLGNISIDAAVPGHVHVDLLNAGKIPDPFWRDQAEQCQ